MPKRGTGHPDTFRVARTAARLHLSLTGLADGLGRWVHPRCESVRPKKIGLPAPNNLGFSDWMRKIERNVLDKEDSPLTSQRQVQLYEKRCSVTDGAKRCRNSQQPRPKGRSLRLGSTAIQNTFAGVRLWFRHPMLQGRLTIAPSSPSPAG